MSSSLSRGDIGMLAVDKLINDAVCTMVRIEDPRSSLVYSYPDNHALVLSKAERQSIIPISEHALKITAKNLHEFESALPFSKTFIQINNDMTPKLLVYDNDDFSEAHSIVACSSEPEAILRMIAVVNARNASFELADQLKVQQQSFSQNTELQNKPTPTSNLKM
ncbi:hypothetical protein [Shewanella colwelliana]|uniref:hypothetical protein n=1 Tax=Shewanella colwelliana TaxID=23 RepID=UPI0022AF5B47|nr:hypothetical protein [Shewanella colwelliana]MCZ4337804.1 hypothetical protein [Shewanella colwelliana]